MNVSEGRGPGGDRRPIGRGRRTRACSTSTPTPHHHRSVLTLAGRRRWRTRPGRWRPRRCAGIDLRDPRRRPSPPGGGRRGALRPPGRARRWTTPSPPATGSRRGRPPNWACPCFLYGPERTLPDVRRPAFVGAGARRRPAVAPSDGRAPSAWAPGRCWWPTTCGWPPGSASSEARRVAAAVRGPGGAGPGLDVGGRAQVSMNLVDPLAYGPAAAYRRRGGPGGGRPGRAGGPGAGGRARRGARRPVGRARPRAGRRPSRAGWPSTASIG